MDPVGRVACGRRVRRMTLDRVLYNGGGRMMRSAGRAASHSQAGSWDSAQAAEAGSSGWTAVPVWGDRKLDPRGAGSGASVSGRLAWSNVIVEDARGVGSVARGPIRSASVESTTRLVGSLRASSLAPAVRMRGRRAVSGGLRASRAARASSLSSVPCGSRLRRLEEKLRIEPGPVLPHDP